MSELPPILSKCLACPVCQHSFDRLSETEIHCTKGHGFRFLAGIPCLINSELNQTHVGYSNILKENALQTGELQANELEDYIRQMIVPVAGNLFHGASLENRLPIPRFPMDLQGSNILLDFGCNWGRWSIAAAQVGFKVIGVDIHLKGLLAASCLAKRYVPENMPAFVLGDVRSLPFADNCFDSIFSYSVLQHFSKKDADLILSECGRVLKKSGTIKVQMPNKMGARSLWVLGKRGFGEGDEFDVRYYGLNELRHKFAKHFGPTSISVDCFFGLNVHKEDLDLIQWFRRPIIWTAEAAKSLSNRIPMLANFADSVYAESVKQ